MAFIDSVPDTTCDRHQGTCKHPKQSAMPKCSLGEFKLTRGAHRWQQRDSEHGHSGDGKSSLRRSPESAGCCPGASPTASPDVATPPVDAELNHPSFMAPIRLGLARSTRPSPARSPPKSRNATGLGPTTTGAYVTCSLSSRRIFCTLSRTLKVGGRNREHDVRKARRISQ